MLVPTKQTPRSSSDPVVLKNYTVKVKSYTVEKYEITACDRRDLAKQLQERMEDGLMDDIKLSDPEIVSVRIGSMSKVDLLPAPKASVKIQCQKQTPMKLPVIQM
jgi:hypothetical protein